MKNIKVLTKTPIASFVLFHRHIQRIENSNWETSFEKIVTDVQSFMKTYHGAELKIC